MVDHVGQTRPPLRVRVAWLLVAQFGLAGLLQPGDSGRWFAHMILFLGAFDIVACCLLYFMARRRRETAPGISLLAASMFAVGSILVAVAGTYTMDFFNVF
jgi:hypothetical protein